MKISRIATPWMIACIAVPTVPLPAQTSSQVCHGAESSLITVDTRKQGLLVTPIAESKPAADGSGLVYERALPVNGVELDSVVDDVEARAEGSGFDMVLGVPSPGQCVEIFSTSTLGDPASWEKEATIVTPSGRVGISDSTADSETRKFYQARAFSFPAGETGFIDDFCDSSTEVNQDSDNYYLRENNDHLGLEIWYQLPTELISVGPVTRVEFTVLEGGIEPVELDESLLGPVDLGQPLRVVWDAPPSPTTDAGFYVIRMDVYVNFQLEWSSPVGDADGDSSNGWQCPQGALVVWDPLWRHRPILHLGAASGGHECPIDPLAFLDVTELWVKSGEEDILVTEDPSVDDLWNHNTKEHFLNIPDGLRIGQNWKIDIGIIEDAQPAIMYTTSNHQGANNNFLFLQYWMFYEFSNSAFDAAADPHHEGDVEYVQMAIRLSAPALPEYKALWMSPYAVTASQHYYAQTIAWIPESGPPGNPRILNRVEHVDNGRFAIFVAEGTHATYLAAGTYPASRDLLYPGCDGVPFLGSGLPWNDPFGHYQESAQRGEHAYSLIPMPNIFRNWKGRWGYKETEEGGGFCATDRNGPPGPFSRAAYRSPDDPVYLLSNPVELHNGGLRNGEASPLFLR